MQRNAIPAFLARATAAFFDIRKDDGVAARGVKIGSTLAQRAVYALADYWLTIASAALVAGLRVLDYGFWNILFALWCFDLGFGAAFVAFWQRTGQDVTLGVSYRRAADVVYADSRLAGRLAFLLVVIKATFWDGPEHIVIFFRHELRTQGRMALALLALTGLQALIWTPIYILGFDGVAELWAYLRGWIV